MTAPAPPLVLPVANPVGPGPWPGPWVDCSRLGIDPEAQLDPAATAFDVVNIEVSAVATATIGKYIAQVQGAQPSKTLGTVGPQSVGSLAFARAVRQVPDTPGPMTLGINLNLAASNLSTGGGVPDLTGLLQEIQFPIAFGLPSYSSSSLLPPGARVSMAQVQIPPGGAFTLGTSITIGTPTAPMLFQDATANNPAATGLYPLAQNTAVGAGGVPVVAYIAGGPLTGFGFVIIQFSLPLP